MRTLGTVIAAALACAALSAPARADIRQAVTVDGPSADIAEVGGVAMAEDGTGGIVYRKRVDGVSHIFAAQFTRGAWKPAQQVDVGQRFDSTFPVIGAANGGQLVAVWAQEYGSGSDRLYSAVLGRGAARFQAPTLVDANIGEALATFPSLSLNRGGAGLLSYNVVGSTDANASLPTGYAQVERRLARFSGQYWSGFGVSFARNAAVPARIPTAANAPKVALDTAGNGIVAWQEPDDEFVDRIWARRVFGGTTGVARQVSPSTWGERPLRGGADSFSVDTAGFGQGAIAFRQLPGENSALTKPVAMVALIPETFVESSDRFGAPQIIDGDAAGAAGPGAPSVAVTATSAYLSAFAGAATALTVRGDDRGAAAPVRIDGGTSTEIGDPQVELAADGAAAVAFGVLSGRRAGVEVHEIRADGVPEQKVVSATRGGVVSGLRLSGSGLGDAIIGFQQGTGAGTQVAATVVDAPASGFQVQTPIDWTRAARVELRWDPPAHSVGGVTYTVTVDDETVAEGLTETGYLLRRDDTAEGRQVVSVIARDDGGQETTSDPAELKIDRRPPEVRIRRTGRRWVRVAIADGRSGVEPASTRLRIGKGKVLRGKRSWRLRLTRAGTYRAVVSARDKAGNAVRIARPVTTR